MTTPVLCRIVHQMHVCTQIHEGQRKLFVNVFNSLLIYFQFFWRIPFQEEDSSAVPVRPPPPPQFPPPPPPRLDFPSSFLFVSSPPPFPRGGSCYTAAAAASVLRNKGLNNIREGVWEKGSIEVRNMSLISDKLHAVFHVKVLRNSAHALLSLRMLDCSCEKDSLQFSTT